MASSARAFWQEVYERFNPERPATNPAWRVSRPYSPRNAIITGLRLPFGTNKHYALLGTVGTGKTTELLAIAEELTRERMVVFLDVWRHFQERVGDPAALDRVQPWEILFLIGLAVCGSAKEVLGHEWAAEHIDSFERAVRGFLDTGSGGESSSSEKRFDVAKLMSNMAVLAGSAVDGGTSAVLKALGTAGQATRWDFRLGERDRERLSDQDPRVQALQNAINLLIGTLHQRYHKLLIVVDGLDRIKNVETTRGLFTESTLLGSLVTATVLTGPLILGQRRLASQMRHFNPKVLANLPVLDQHAPDRPGPGIDFFLDLYRLRVADMAEGDQRIPEPLLHKLAYYSGGRARDFVRFIRMTAERAWVNDAEVADAKIIDSCIDEWRRVMEMGLHRGIIQVLKQVMEDPDHLLPESNQVEELLDQCCLIPFPNESEWYYPHPLLTLRLVRRG